MWSGRRTRLANRLEWRRRLRESAIRAPDAEVIWREIETPLVYPETQWDPACLAALEANRDKVIDMLVRLDGALTERERGSVRERLSELADDPGEVAARRT